MLCIMYKNYKFNVTLRSNAALIVTRLNIQNRLMQSEIPSL